MSLEPRVLRVIPGDPEGTLRAWAALLNTFVLPGSNPTRSFADGDTTPSVLGAEQWETANTGATSITNFDDGFRGQGITVLLDANTTLVHDVNKIYLRTGGNLAGAAGMAVAFMLGSDGVWYEVART